MENNFPPINEPIILDMTEHWQPDNINAFYLSADPVFTEYTGFNEITVSGLLSVSLLFYKPTGCTYMSLSDVKHI